MISKLLSQAQLGTINGIGPLGNQTTGSVTNTLLEFELVISNVIGLMTILAGVYFLFQLIISSYNWISAGGDKQQVQNGLKRIQNALIGLVVTIAAYGIAGVIGRVFGLSLLRPAILLINLHP